MRDVRRALRFPVCLTVLLFLICIWVKSRDQEFFAQSKLPTLTAELVAKDASWGNTEGPTVDSKGTFFFTSRGSFKGIVSWTSKEGARQYLAVATKEGPGGLWVDDHDNILLTATGERKIMQVSPDKKVTVVAENFEADPSITKGPNDLVVAKNGTIYFTDPNGFYGDAPNGTVYRIAPDGKTSVFNADITGPNGIALSANERILYVSHNVSKTTSKIEQWSLNKDGSAGKRTTLAAVENCVADGMAVDKQGGIWLTCYGFGTAYRVSATGKILESITTDQKALTNCRFGRRSERHTLYLTSSDMERVTGYIYRAKVGVPGLR